MRPYVVAVLLAVAGAAPAVAQTTADTSIAPPQEIATITVGQTRSGMLEAGDWSMADATWCDVWYLELAAGQSVTIELRSRAFDAYLQLLDPYGIKISDDDDSAGGGNSRIRFTAHAAGRYQIIVNNFGDTRATGLYTLSVR